MGVYIKFGMKPIEPPGCVATKGNESSFHEKYSVYFVQQQ